MAGRERGRERRESRESRERRERREREEREYTYNRNESINKTTILLKIHKA